MPSGEYSVPPRVSHKQSIHEFSELADTLTEMLATMGINQVSTPLQATEHVLRRRSKPFRTRSERSANKVKREPTLLRQHYDITIADSVSRSGKANCPIHGLKSRNHQKLIEIQSSIPVNTSFKFTVSLQYKNSSLWLHIDSVAGVNQTYFRTTYETLTYYKFRLSYQLTISYVM